LNILNIVSGGTLALGRDFASVAIYIVVIYSVMIYRLACLKYKNTAQGKLCGLIILN